VLILLELLGKGMKSFEKAKIFATFAPCFNVHKMKSSIPTKHFVHDFELCFL